MSLKKQLERYKKHLKSTQQKPAPEAEVIKEKKKDQYESELMYAAKELGAEVCHFEDQFTLVRTEHIPLETIHGEMKFEELFATVAAWNDRKEGNPLSAKGLHAEELLFFDTETTGLGSGSGHMIFLIGWAKVEKTGVTIKQYFLPGPGHEAAFYHFFLKDSHHLKNLVTYNGKSFDWPRVKTRHQFVKDRVPNLPLFGHFDLLHASRRLWKQTLENTKLETIEKEILKTTREMDIPGHMAPFLYFQFLKRPNAALIRGVMEHNKEDIKSLITLYVHLSQLIMGEIPLTTHETFEMARWNEQLGFMDLSIAQYKSIENNPYWTRKTYEKLALIYKRKGYIKLSHTAYETLISLDGQTKPAHLIELAKIQEHYEKDYIKAHAYTEMAIIETKQQTRLFQQKKEQELSQMMHRKNRLERKIKRWK